MVTLSIQELFWVAVFFIAVEPLLRKVAGFVWGAVFSSFKG